MAIIKTELRVAKVGIKSVFFVAIHVNSVADMINLTDIKNAVNQLGGLPVDGYAAIESSYYGYDDTVTSFVVQDGRLSLTQTQRDRSLGNQTLSESNIILTVDSTYNIQPLTSSYGYSGGNPWVEFSPMLTCVRNNKCCNLVPAGGQYAYYYNNNAGNISVTNVNGQYRLIIDSTVPATTTNAYYYVRSTEIDIDSFSSTRDITVDPYSPDSPPTTIGGGDGTHTIPQNNITIPPIPTYGYSSTGFFSIWIPNDDQLKQLAAFMWNADITTIDFWKRLISDPIDLIIGLSVLPFYISPQGVESVSLGGLDSRINMSYTEEQFIDISCGSVSIPEVWGAYLDYNPYTKVEIFLPYIGTRELNVDEIMGRTISVTYRVDIVSGSCVALIEASKDDVSMLLYHFDGNCAVPVPITSFQMQGLVNKILATGGAVGAAIASGGAAIPVAGAVASALSLATTKRTAQRSGNIGSAAGLLDVQIPYLVFTRPNQAVPENQNTYTGYPSFITQNLSSLIGYTEVEVIHLHNIPCTEAELLEIDSLLKGGVIF